jgi:MFS transporter, putative metabolite:H+ symporter
LATEKSTSSQRAEGTPRIANLLDVHPVTYLHLAVVAICACGFSFDLLEVSLGSVLSAVFSAGPHRISSNGLAWMLASAYVGAVVGTPVLGLLADRYGRRTILSAALLWLAPVSVALALSQTPAVLSTLRLLSGLALGAYPPVMMTYLTDILPARRRATLILVLVAIASLGPPGGLLLVHAFTHSMPLGIEGWRWGFLLSGMGAFCGGMLFRSLPESPRWLLTVGRDGDAAIAWQAFESSRAIGPMAAHARSQVFQQHVADGLDYARGPDGLRGRVVSPRRHMYLMAVLFFLGAWGTVGFPLLSGAVLVQKGIKLSDTLLYLAIATIGSTIGTLLAALKADLVERRAGLITCTAAMAMFAMGFAISSSPFWLVTTSLVFTVTMALYLPALFVYAAELFPTPMRGSATAVAWAANRAGSALAPFVLLPLLQHRGAVSMAFVMTATLLSSTLVVLSFGPGRQGGRPVE